MVTSSPGAFVMVKFLFTISLMFYTNNAFAGFYVGLQNNSWQDVIPVTYTDTTSGAKVSFLALTSFSSISAGGGYDSLLSTRWRYFADLYMHSGNADILKIQGTVSPRKSFTSQWVSGCISYRFTKTFSIGPQLVINAVSVKDAGSATSLGLLIHSQIEVSNNYRFIQTFGSMNDSGTIAYTIGLQRYF